MPKLNRRFAGLWRIVELSEMTNDYLGEGEGKPFIRLKASYEDMIDGGYEIGLSSGVIDGAVRFFGGDTIVVFGFDGSDEMDPASGGGWMRLRQDGKLEGEFVNGLGPFVARRVPSTKSKSSRRRPA